MNNSVQEWDDGACLEHAVERLDAERREMQELACLRRCVAASTGLTLTFLAALSVLAMVTTIEPLMAGAMVALLRGAIVDGIDQEITEHRQRAALRHQELQARIESSDWLLES